MSSALEEHHGYLSIAGRLDIYKAAIAQQVSHGFRVADLGCGVGVLGLECLKAGAARVYGIDCTEAIELARETMQRAGLAERYVCIRESTYRVTLPEKVDAIICDHVGYFGFDYGIIAMMRDARERLLKPGGAVIPCRIDPVVAGVSSPTARRKAEEWTEADFPPEYRWLNEYARNSKHALTPTPEDLCTAAAVMGTIRLDGEDVDRYAMQASLKVLRDGMFEGLAGWFACELAEGVWMTNSPLAPDRIDRSNVFLPCKVPFAVRAGDNVGVSLRFNTEGDMIVWQITTPAGAVQRMSTWNSRVLGKADLAVPTGAPLTLNATARARQMVYALVDGTRSADDIERAVLEAHPQLFPTREETIRFVRRELGYCAQ